MWNGSSFSVRLDVLQMQKIMPFLVNMLTSKFAEAKLVLLNVEFENFELRTLDTYKMHMVNCMIGCCFSRDDYRWFAIWKGFAQILVLRIRVAKRFESESHLAPFILLCLLH